MVQVESINRNEAAPLEIDMDDGVILSMTTSHIKSLTDALTQARDGMPLTGDDMAKILWPISELLNASHERALNDSSERMRRNQS